MNIHLVRACLSHALTDERNTRLVARVLARVRALDCPHGIDGCNGPTATSDRCGGLPCPDCIDSVRCERVSDYEVWQALGGAC